MGMGGGGGKEGMWGRRHPPVGSPPPCGGTPCGGGTPESSLGWGVCVLSPPPLLHLCLVFCCFKGKLKIKPPHPRLKGGG